MFVLKATHHRHSLHVRTLALNCLTTHYAPLWEELFDAGARLHRRGRLRNPGTQRGWSTGPLLLLQTDGRTVPRHAGDLQPPPDGISLANDQTIVPIPVGEDSHSLSAILVDANYYALISQQQETRDGLSFATATALIPLKAKAWLDLSARKLAGETIDAKNIAKHRADVFRLAATLPGDTSVELPDPSRADLAAFLTAFPDDSSEWPAILSAIKNTVGGNLQTAALRSAILTFFQVS